MYRILVVDDEPYAVEYIIELLSGCIGIDAYKAYCAKEALALLDKTRMDIVFTDIRMPGMDGVALTKQVLEKWPDTYVVILTGYGDFEILYDMQKMKHVTYLIKTDEPQAIVHAAENAIRSLEESIRYDELEREMSERNSEYIRLKQQEYLLGLMQGRAQLPTPALFSDLCLELDAERPVYLTVARFSGVSAVLTAETVHRSVEAKLLLAYAFLNLETILFFVQPRDPSSDKEQMDVFLDGALEMAQNRCYNHLGVTITFVISDNALPFTKVHLPLNRLLSLLRQEDAPTNAERILRLDDALEENRAAAQAPELIKQAGDLEYLYATRDQAAFTGRLQSILTAAVRVQNCPFSVECELYYTLVLLFFRLANSCGNLNPTSLDALLALKPLAWEEAAPVFIRLTELLFALPEGDPQERLVCAIEAYVHQNLGFGLSLVSIASHFHFNPSYLSRLYKQIRGNTLFSYITGERIQLAKALLCDPAQRLADISVRLGYETATYFCHFFKKMTGSTPQEYRDSFLNR